MKMISPSNREVDVGKTLSETEYIGMCRCVCVCVVLLGQISLLVFCCCPLSSQTSGCVVLLASVPHTVCAFMATVAVVDKVPSIHQPLVLRCALNRPWHASDAHPACVESDKMEVKPAQQSQADVHPVWCVCLLLLLQA
jgi:hypothetical protein